MKYNVIFLPLLTLSCSAATHEQSGNNQILIEIVAKSKTEIAFKYDTKDDLYCIPSSNLAMNAFLVAGTNTQEGKLVRNKFSDIANFAADSGGVDPYLTMIYGKGEIILERANNVESQTVYGIKIAKCAHLKTKTAPIEGYYIGAVFQN